MINVNVSKCKHYNCKKSATFNYINESTPIYCNEHKKIDMTNVKSKRCKEDNYTRVTFGEFAGTHGFANSFAH